MEALTAYITERLQTYKYCSVFPNRLELAFPRKKDPDMERWQRKVSAFAARNGWSAQFYDPGVRVTFRRLTGANGSESPRHAKSSKDGAKEKHDGLYSVPSPGHKGSPSRRKYP
jgi:hypothetical protein